MCVCVNVCIFNIGDFQNLRQGDTTFLGKVRLSDNITHASAGKGS